jgi:hypothetical protein
MREYIPIDHLVTCGLAGGIALPWFSLGKIGYRRYRIVTCRGH